jgi:hypothetical protein
VRITQQDPRHDLQRCLAEYRFQVFDHFLAPIGVRKDDLSIFRRSQAATLARQRLGRLGI